MKTLTIILFALLFNIQAYSQKDTSELIILPVVVHIYHLGEDVGEGFNFCDDQVRGYIRECNEVYSGKKESSGRRFFLEDTRIRFKLVSKDPDNNPTNGIIRIDGRSIEGYEENGCSSRLPFVQDSHWPEEDYINLYFVHDITFASAFSNLGPTQTSSSGLFLVPREGCHPTISGSTAHELAHYIGMTHYDMAQDSIPGLFQTKDKILLHELLAQTNTPKIINSSKLISKTFNYIDILDDHIMHQDQCYQVNQFPLKVLNSGYNTINDIGITASINDSIIGTFNWQGNIPSGERQMINIDNINIEAIGLQEINFKITSVNNNTPHPSSEASYDLKVNILPEIEPSACVYTFQDQEVSFLNQVSVVLGDYANVYSHSKFFDRLDTMMIMNGHDWSINVAGTSTSLNNRFLVDKLSTSKIGFCFSSDEETIFQFDKKQVIKDSIFDSSFRLFIDDEKIYEKQGYEDWVTMTFPVTAANNSTHKIVFEANSYKTLDYGNYIALDNIRLTHDLSIIDEDCEETIITSTDELNPLNIELFPNPVQSELIIKAPTGLIYEVELFNLQGQSLFNALNPALIAVRDFTNGVYTVRITDKSSNQFIIQKIIIAK